MAIAQWHKVLKLGDKSNEIVRLQEYLVAVGIITGIDGEFGNNTRRAVELFQWNASTIPYRVWNGHLKKVDVSYTSVVLGAVDELTHRELFKWVALEHKATGDLRRVNVSQLSNVYLKSGFTTLGSSNKNECLMSRELVKYLSRANRKANKLKVKVQLNQTFRLAGQPVRGAVVTPAKKSQHLIGHAWDCNIIDGSESNRKKDFKAGKESDNAKKLVDYLKAKGLRWGGDFKGRKGNQIWDTPHFDKQLDSDSQVYQFKYFFNQLTVQNNDPIVGIRFT